MSGIKIKVCGMKYADNIADVILLKPDFVGFILYKASPRFVSLKDAATLVKAIAPSIGKVGVIVNESYEEAKKIAQSGIFDFLQLHGNESADYCRTLSDRIQIIKAFSISQMLPDDLSDYEPFCKMFLFDAAGDSYGGTGKMFNHSLLENYSLNTDYIIGGGISSSDSAYVKSIYSGRMAGIDLNSRFEIRPGFKDIQMLTTFIENIRNNDNNT